MERHPRSKRGVASEERGGGMEVRVSIGQDSWLQGQKTELKDTLKKIRAGSGGVGPHKWVD